MYILLIILIIIASVLLVLAVLAQNPKGGMAANFGASNQVMGVRQTADFLERSTWVLSIAIVILSLLASIAISSHKRNSMGVSDKVIEQITTEREIALPNSVAPVTEQPAMTGTDTSAKPAESGTAGQPANDNINITIAEPNVIEISE